MMTTTCEILPLDVPPDVDLARAGALEKLATLEPQPAEQTSTLNATTARMGSAFENI